MAKHALIFVSWLSLVTLIVSNASGQEPVASTKTSDTEVLAEELGSEDLLSERNTARSKTNEDSEKAAEAVLEEAPAPESEQPEINPDASFTPTEEISEDRPVPFPVDI